MLIRGQNSRDPVLGRLHALIEASPDLKEAALLYGAMLPVLQNAPSHVAAVPLTRGQAREKMEQGLPLLFDLDLDLDVDAVQGIMISLAGSVEAVWRRNRPHHWQPWGGVLHESEEAARSIRLALEAGKLDVTELIARVSAGEWAHAAATSRDQGLDPDLVWTLAQNALKPALREWRGQLALSVEGVSWNKGNCYVCGAVATLGELQENDQVKHLRCGACGADWKYPRLQCAYCSNEDHRKQHYFAEEGKEETTRVETCDACNGYLKVISSFSSTLPELLLIEDLATLHLDYMAQERGYVKHSSEFKVQSSE